MKWKPARSGNGGRWKGRKEGRKVGEGKGRMNEKKWKDMRGSDG